MNSQCNRFFIEIISSYIESPNLKNPIQFSRVHELNNELLNISLCEKKIIIQKLNYLLTKEKMKRYLNRFVLCKNKSDDKCFVGAIGKSFKYDYSYDFEIYRD